MRLTNHLENAETMNVVVCVFVGSPLRTLSIGRNDISASELNWLSMDELEQLCLQKFVIHTQSGLVDHGYDLYRHSSSYTLSGYDVSSAEAMMMMVNVQSGPLQNEEPSRE
eukprot:348702-Pleurochrysis_carterae.AAC.2